MPLLQDEGLPLGLQLLGATDRDAALFDVANWVARDAFGRPIWWARRADSAFYAFHKLLNCVATTSSYLPTPLVSPTVCTNLHMLSNVSLEIAGS